MSRRRTLKAAVWSVPVVAVAVATPLAAASVTSPFSASITSITPAGFADWYTLSIVYNNIPTDRNPTGRLTWSSSEGSTIGSSSFFVQAPGSTITLVDFPKGVPVTFTVTISNATPSPYVTSFVHIF